jgi:hypothetical protein
MIHAILMPQKAVPWKLGMTTSEATLSLLTPTTVVPSSPLWLQSTNPNRLSLTKIITTDIPMKKMAARGSHATRQLVLRGLREYPSILPKYALTFPAYLEGSESSTKNLKCLFSNQLVNPATSSPADDVHHYVIP